jgi:hypothetical protein
LSAWYGRANYNHCNRIAVRGYDGVLNVDKDYLHEAEDVEWIPYSLEAIAWLNRFLYTGGSLLDLVQRIVKSKAVVQD